MVIEKLSGIDESPDQIRPDPPLLSARKFLAVSHYLFDLRRSRLAGEDGKIYLFDPLVILHAASGKHPAGETVGVIVYPDSHSLNPCQLR